MSSSGWPGWQHYELYVGRYSRQIAVDFLDWLFVPAGSRWLDVGCGPGALTEIILEQSSSESVTGVDLNQDFIGHARHTLARQNTSFQLADARELPFGDDAFDAVVSGLVLNFIVEPERALAEMARVVRPGGVTGCYVWDFEDGLLALRAYWDSANEVDPAAWEYQQDYRASIPLTRPGWLREAFMQAGFEQIQLKEVTLTQSFPDFDTLWDQLLHAGDSIQRFASSLDDERLAIFKQCTAARLPVSSDGSIDLTLRAWAVKAKQPE